MDESTLLDFAKIAEQAERYEDMAEYMKTLVVEKGKHVLTDEERNLLSVAYKNIVGSRRTASRVIDNSMDAANNKDNQMEVEICKDYKGTIVKELNTICDAVVKLLDDYLIKAVQDDEVPEAESCAKTDLVSSKIFYQKMKGDYFRYKVEVECDDDIRGNLASSSESAYKEATRIAEKHLAPTHPIRLGLALNFSVFYYEIKNEQREAIVLANKAFEDAIAELDKDDGCHETSYKDSTLILQLLRDNLNLWKGANDERQQEQDQDD